VETQYTPSGPDILISGYLPSSGGLLALERSLSYPEHKRASLLPGAWGAKAALKGKQPAPGGAAAAAEAEEEAEAEAAAAAEAALGRNKGRAPRVISFYKAWDEWGALGNFSPHPIRVGGEGGAAAGGEPADAGAGGEEVWPSVEHFYQAAKFQGVDSPAARDLIAGIKAAPSPEEAARIGRRAERHSSELVRPDWGQSKRAAMTRALRAKYAQHAGPRRMLLSTAGDAAAGVPPAQLVEASPNDHTWWVPRASCGDVCSPVWAASRPLRPAPATCLRRPPHPLNATPPPPPLSHRRGQGFSGGGQNQLGQLLMQLRDELVAEEEAAVAGLQQEQRRSDQQQQRREALGTAS
jgi:diaminohydroxyphosphoribosylaminopyrimidine deaminase/5-amino-6-(5-phosphoribosylamino)uracil reductase